ncbi:MAG: hypothetical protein LAP86_28215 [Acidobacteriia bacterium]|nr:hypothetical protein [Terriglobia bacterium]
MNSPPSSLTLAARFPGLRALTWAGDQLYASRGYQLLRARVEDARHVIWQPVAHFRPSLRRRFSVTNRFTARLLRDGFHALAVLPSGAIIGAIPGSIVTLRPGEFQFRPTHAITRGTRPLHITATPGGAVFWGEYFDNAQRDEVHVYGSPDAGATWSIAYTFPKGKIRHVHNMVHDPWADCLWILTGDYGDECSILRASCDFSHVEIVMQGNQQARAVAAVPTEDALYFSSDTPLERNHIYRLDREGKLSQLAQISSSSIYGCRVGRRVFFSTMIEPSEVNRDRIVRVYGGEVKPYDSWQSLLEWKKDPLPMRLFQYGNAFLPDGENSTLFLAVSTIAVESDDLCTSLYAVQSTT